MGRPAKGSVELSGDHYKVRLSMPDGSRPWHHLEPGWTLEEAEEIGRGLAKLAKEGKLPVAPKRVRAGEETVAQWMKRWLDHREARGLTSVKGDRGRLTKHVLPCLGAKPMGKVSRTDLEALVSTLDTKIRDGETAWKSATNVWGLVTKMFDDAAHSKSLDLRVRADDPTEGVRGPDRGAKKAKVYLYPSEVLAVLTCERVPSRWRRLFALSVYLYLRAGELRSLTWGDVDLEHGTVHVHRGFDRMRSKAKATKGNAARRFPVEPELLPLLRALHTESGGVGAVVKMPHMQILAVRLRKYLEWAGVTRADLFASDATRKHMTFHDLRATGITWMAIRGDEPLRIKQRAGHTDFATTEGYIREAEQLTEGFGAVFPALPAGVICPEFRPANFSRGVQPRGMMKQKEVGRVGLEPRCDEATGVFLVVSETAPVAEHHPERTDTALEGKTPDSIRGRSAVVIALAGALLVALREGDHEGAQSITETLSKLNVEGRASAPVLRLVEGRAKLGGAS